jgi:hypothetical protein
VLTLCDAPAVAGARAMASPDSAIEAVCDIVLALPS